MILKRRLFAPSNMLALILWTVISIASFPPVKAIEYLYIVVASTYWLFFGVSLVLYLSKKSFCAISHERITITVGRRSRVCDLSLYVSIQHQHRRLLGLHLIVAKRLSDGARAVLLSSLEYKGDFAKVAAFLNEVTTVAN
ncbi:MAG TPA: hypothetical protein DCR44_06770 [Acholeplasmatales bacterium]|nr:MAG: hypothetical protein A2Y16_01885 [Tenericutes bacterium GWF2_57_13]HAQ57082.1 hypothetical protein [Acholeplasmatales bacterium]